MALVPQPLPWTVSPGREIGDGAGNIVQYTIANLGAICLAVNAHDRLISVLGEIESWLRLAPAHPLTKEQMIELVASATGRIGFGALAAKIEDAQGPSPEMDRALSVEMQIPEAAYTLSIDAALTLVPPGYAFGFSTKEQINAATGQPVIYTAVELKSGDKVAMAASLSLPLAICAAALKAKEI